MSDINSALIAKENSETAIKLAAGTKSVEEPVAEEKTATNTKLKGKSEVATTETAVKASDAEKMGSDKQTKLHKEIIRQVEYYFGDFNLSRDKFLMEQISNSVDGWVSLNVLIIFKSLSALTTDAQTIVDAITKSDEGLVQLSDDKQKLRRHPERPIPALTDDLHEEWVSSTIYAEGFPLDAELSDIIDFFEQFEKVLNVAMNKYADKNTKTHKFNGSVFVTFEKREQAAAFIRKDKVFYKECELMRFWQKKHLQKNVEEMPIRSKNQQQHQKTTGQWKLPKLPKGAVVFFEKFDLTVTGEMFSKILVAADWKIADIKYNREENSGCIQFREKRLARKLYANLEENKLKLEGDLEARIMERKRRNNDNGTAAEKKSKAEG